MTGPKLSLITIAYNSAATIGRTLESVARQEGIKAGEVEHWVIDGGSRDSTMEIVRKYPQVRSISERDRGISDAFSKGVRTSSGEWIQFLNSDDELADPGVLRDVLDALDPTFDVIYGRLSLVDQQSGVEFLTVGADGAWRFLHQRMTIPNPATYMHRRYFERYGTFDESYRIVMDYELLLRGFREAKFRFVPRMIARFSTGGVSDVNRGYREALECRRAKALHGAQNPLTRFLWAIYQSARPALERKIRNIPLLQRPYSWLAARMSRGL